MTIGVLLSLTSRKIKEKVERKHAEFLVEAIIFERREYWTFCVTLPFFPFNSSVLHVHVCYHDINCFEVRSKNFLSVEQSVDIRFLWRRVFHTLKISVETWIINNFNLTATDILNHYDLFCVSLINLFCYQSTTCVLMWRDNNIN